MQDSVSGLSHQPVCGGPEALSDAPELVGTGSQKPTVCTSSSPTSHDVAVIA